MDKQEVIAARAGDADHHHYKNQFPVYEHANYLMCTVKI